MLCMTIAFTTSYASRRPDVTLIRPAHPDLLDCLSIGVRSVILSEHADERALSRLQGDK